MDRNVKNNKAVGNDGLVNAVLKYGDCISLCNILVIFYKEIIKIGYIPESYNCAIRKPISKKDKLSGPSDYRPISIFSV